MVVGHVLSTEPPAQTILFLSLLGNLLCLVLYQCARASPYFGDLLNTWYRSVTPFFSLQFVVATGLFRIGGTTGLVLEAFLAYGFGFDFFLGSEGGRDPGPHELAMRFVSNLVHHTTLSLGTTSTEALVYALCWAIHTFPVLARIGQPQHISTIGAIGNWAPAVGGIYLIVSGSVAQLSRAQRVVLLQMFFYRSLYQNFRFKVLARYMPQHVHDILAPATKCMSAAVSIIAAVYIFSIV